jgi:hypothetical protein
MVPGPFHVILSEKSAKRVSMKGRVGIPHVYRTINNERET